LKNHRSSQLKNSKKFYLTQDKSSKKFYQKIFDKQEKKKFFRNKKFDKQEKRKRFFQDGKDFLTKKDLTVR